MSHLSLDNRIRALVTLGHLITSPDGGLMEAVRQAGLKNPWFTESNCLRALEGIGKNFLDATQLRSFADSYRLPALPGKVRNVAIVMAGNIPLVGFHDWLCVFLAGHRALIKLSDKDAVLLPYLLQCLAEIHPETADQAIILDKLTGFDAVIATGSDNSARYFKHYFSKVPHLIRANRNGIAVIHGDESSADLDGLSKDIAAYFGLGCRSVSHLYVPKGYDFIPLMERLDQMAELEHHDRYRNNYDYQCALLLLNKIPFLQGRNILLREDPALISPMACLHYSPFATMDELVHLLETRRTAIQCVVSAKEIPGWHVVMPGMAQSPELADFADGVDTMQFLIGLHDEANG